jgi:hypothetical protein
MIHRIWVSVTGFLSLYLCTVGGRSVLLAFFFNAKKIDLALEGYRNMPVRGINDERLVIEILGWIKVLDILGDLTWQKE